MNPPSARTFRLVRFTTLAACVLLAGCSQYASVSEKKPLFHPLPAPSGALAALEQNITGALKIEQRDPMGALAGYLAAADAAADLLGKSPEDKAARNDYNFAVARILATIREAKLDPWTQPLRVPAAGGDYVLTHRPDPLKERNPNLYDFTPADQFDVKGTYVTEHSRKEGVGAPIVAIGREMNKNARGNFSLPRTYYGVTAVARFRDRRCTMSFEDPLASETTVLNGRTFPLAADFTAPIAVMLASTDPKKMELARLLRPQKYADTARLARLQPYDPGKTAVLVVHGLMDSPATWTPMLNSLRNDAFIRQHYQFWFYSYPSGYPYPHTAALLRKELDAIQQKFPLKKPMIVIGHSMGGCISRLLITDSGNALWSEFFPQPPSEVPLTPVNKAFFTDALIFRHRPEIGRAILMAAPLRGSDLASNWLGRLGARLVKSPTTILSAGTEALKIIATRGGSLKVKRMPNSVDTMSPKNRFVQAINRIPITPGIPYHTIVGDRGKGGNPDHTKPVKSDGFVPYWSSHLEGAQSELTVPSNHSVHQNRQAIKEVKRLLRLHAGASAPRS